MAGERSVHRPRPARRRRAELSHPGGRGGTGRADLLHPSAAIVCLAVPVARLRLRSDGSGGAHERPRARTGRGHPAGPSGGNPVSTRPSPDFRTAIGLELGDDLRYVLLMNRGVMRFLRRQYEPSALRTSGRRSPSTAAATMRTPRLAQSLRRLGRTAEAIEQFDKACSLAPGVAALYRGRAAARTDLDKPTPDDIRAAVHDLEESASREPDGSRAKAEDHVRRAKLLRSLDSSPEGLSAANQAAADALAIDPGLAEAHRVRVKILLEMKQYGDAIRACDVALAGPSIGPCRTPPYTSTGASAGPAATITPPPSPITPWPSRRSRTGWRFTFSRGWTYLAANAPELASHDFEKAVELAPDDPSGYAGLGASKVRRGQIRRGLVDVEESLRRASPSPSPRILFIAAQTYANAYTAAEADARRRGRSVSNDALTYESRAEVLLREALQKTPAGSRLAFWQDYVAKDPMIQPIFRNPQLLRRLPTDQSMFPALNRPVIAFDTGGNQASSESCNQVRVKRQTDVHAPPHEGDGVPQGRPRAPGLVRDPGRPYAPQRRDGVGGRASQRGAAASRAVGHGRRQRSPPGRTPFFPDHPRRERAPDREGPFRGGASPALTPRRRRDDVLVQSDGQSSTSIDPLIDQHLALGSVEYSGGRDLLARVRGTPTLTAGLTATSDPLSTISSPTRRRRPRRWSSEPISTTTGFSITWTWTKRVHLGAGERVLPQPAVAGNLSRAVRRAREPTSIVVGDFSGHGKTDLAVAYPTSGIVKILLSNGDGTFRLSQTITDVPGP